MRLTLLAIIFALILTLGNALLMKNEQKKVAAANYSAIQLGQKRSAHYEWDAFIWREIGAVALTVVLFGAIQVFAASSTHER